MVVLSLKSHGVHRHLHSFPTRRSSDLGSSPTVGTLFGSTVSRYFHPQQRSAPRSRLPACSLLETGERSEEHTSELQSRRDLVCRLLLETKKTSSARWSLRRSVEVADPL